MMKKMTTISQSDIFMLLVFCPILTYIQPSIACEKEKQKKHHI